MLNFVNKYAKHGRCSQNGEAGILEECLRRMEIQYGSCVEIGGHDGLYCSNTAELIESGWKGKFVESDYTLHLKCKANWVNNPNVTCQCSQVDGKNINAFVDDTCDVLSLDTDGGDFLIFSGLKAKPKIVIVEIDSSIEPHRYSFNVDGGAGYWPMVALGHTRGYFLLCHTGNLIFVREDYKRLFPEIAYDPIIGHEKYFNQGWLKEDAA